jgi:preprotein translocase subunit SecE
MYSGSGTRVRDQEKEKQKPKPRAKPAQAKANETRFARIQRFVHDIIAEMRKISWPDRETTRNLTILVIAISVVLGLLLGAVDALFVRLWEAIPSL